MTFKKRFKSLNIRGLNKEINYWINDAQILSTSDDIPQVQDTINHLEIAKKALEEKLKRLKNK